MWKRSVQRNREILEALRSEKPVQRNLMWKRSVQRNGFVWKRSVQRNLALRSEKREMFGSAPFREMQRNVDRASYVEELRSEKCG